MIDRFLKAKHWQLFLLIYGVPTIIQTTIIGSVISSPKSASFANHSDTKVNMILYLILTLVFSTIFAGWLWSAAIGLQKKIPAHVSMKTKRFKTFFFILATYMLLILTILGLWFIEAIDLKSIKAAGLREVLVVFFIGFHILTVFSFFYTFYFIARTFKTVELQRAVRFREFVAEFVLILFYPIGLWVLQPSINEMMDEEMSSPYSE